MLGKVFLCRTVKLAMDSVGRKCLCLFQKVGLLREDDDKCLAFLAAPKLMQRNTYFRPLQRLYLKAETFLIWT